MYYIRSYLSESRLRARVGKVIRDCVASELQVKTNVAECVQLSDEHPAHVLNALAEQMPLTRPHNSHSALRLLEHLVSTCNYAFHVALAHHGGVQERLLAWATHRTESDAQRRTQRLARLALLEYSRMFVDDPALAPLARLADTFARRTHKNLMRCINLQRRKVRFRDPTTADYVAISPRGAASSSSSGGGSGSGGARPVAPIDLRAPEVWRCPACHNMNAPAAGKCTACETVRDTAADRALRAAETARAEEQQQQQEQEQEGGERGGEGEDGGSQAPPPPQPRHIDPRVSLSTTPSAATAPATATATAAESLAPYY